MLQNGKIGVLGTDTLYGLVGSAMDENVVARIFEIKGRQENKPLIILISSYDDTELFGIKVTPQLKLVLEKYWPSSVSIILPCPDLKFSYLHRGTNTLAFRLPAKESLIEILKKTWPLVAPSANPEGLPPAKTTAEAKKYFGDRIDFYIDEGLIDNPPSKLISIDKNNKINVLRQ